MQWMLVYFSILQNIFCFVLLQKYTYDLSKLYYTIY